MADNYYQATVSPELPAALFNEEELQALEIACGLSCEKIEDHLYFFADTSFRAEGEDDEDATVDCLALMQAKLRQLDPVAYSCITIQGAATCSKMRPDEFGGFAHLITRDDVCSMSTWQWLDEQTPSTWQSLDEQTPRDDSPLTTAL
jgi:hypothetical protein